MQALDTWWDYVQGRGHVQQWETARALVWCAEQAAAHPDFYRTEIDRVCFFALTEPPEFIQDKVWAWVCIRTFLDAPSRRVEIPAVAWEEGQDESQNKPGLIAILVLEVLEGGAGQVVHHPMDAFTTHFDEGFARSMQDAWRGALTLSGKGGVDGRWRVLQRGHPMPEVRGRSAGGAAARGWYHALQGTFPDEGVIVLATIDAQGQFGPVGEVVAKVAAIAEDGRFDTIIVAGETDRRTAEGELRRLNKSQMIRVVNLNDGDA